MNKILLSSKKMDYVTPDYLYNPLNDIFDFQIDLAADSNNFKCKKQFFNEKDDSLSFNWEFNECWCWLNPPYGRHLCKWVEKSYISNINYNTKFCLLIPARTDTNYFHEFITKANLIIFLRGRIKFDGCKYNAPFPSQLVFFGNVKYNQVIKLKKLKLGYIINYKGDNLNYG